MYVCVKKRHNQTSVNARPVDRPINRPTQNPPTQTQHKLNTNTKQLGFPPQGTTGYYSANATKADAAAVQAFLDGKNISAYVSFCVDLFCVYLLGDGSRASRSHAHTHQHPDSKFRTTDRYNTRLFNSSSSEDGGGDAFIVRQAAAEAADAGSIEAEPLEGGRSVKVWMDGDMCEVESFGFGSVGPWGVCMYVNERRHHQPLANVPIYIYTHTKQPHT
jgi:hypothetical protein